MVLTIANISNVPAPIYPVKQMKKARKQMTSTVLRLNESTMNPLNGRISSVAMT